MQSRNRTHRSSDEEDNLVYNMVSRPDDPRTRQAGQFALTQADMRGYGHIVDKIYSSQ